jgi:uncharacterized protein DUF397
MEPVSPSGRIWIKSSYSASGNCVEIARIGQEIIGIRDSKNADGPHIEFGKEEWRAFLRQVKA